MIFTLSYFKLYYSINFMLYFRLFYFKLIHVILLYVIISYFILSMTI
jgi:hypothetical protein